MEIDRTSESIALMSRFADRTGLTSSRPAKRYLWTDAFAVCNFLGLARATGETRYEELALRLIDQVHHELGRRRADDRRGGWLSGLPDAEAEAHPTRGGLRIGKPLRERAPGEPLDPELEWDRDGQYFHYLTKWMHALGQAARQTGRAELSLWARELSDVAHRAFTYGPTGERRMAWKLSTDLSRPLVPSMGQHDPLDGFVTCLELDASAAALGLSSAAPSLHGAASDFAQMLGGQQLVTSDPLGLGGLLFDACRLAQVHAGEELVPWLLSATSIGLRSYLTQPDLRAPAGLRLAFRELGLSIGLAAVPMLERERGRDGLAELAPYEPLRKEIETFWLDTDHRRTSTWTEHEDINDVMLATSLAPDGFLRLDLPQASAESASVRADERRL